MLALLLSAQGGWAQTSPSGLTPEQIAVKRSELERQKAAIQAEIDKLDQSRSAAPMAEATPAQPSGAGFSPTSGAVVSQVTVTAATPVLTQRPTGQAVATVTRDLYKDQPNVGIAEVLDLVPGVSVIQGNGPRDVSVSIRGSNDRQSYAVRNIQLFEDGFPVTQPDGTGRMDLTDPHAYGAIDVVEGPSSALYGNYATGGAINFHTRSGGDIEGVDVGADFGSYGYDNDYATIGGKGDRYEYAAFVSNVRAGGATSHSDYDTVTENILATYQATPTDRVTFKLINNDLDTDLSIRLSLNQFKQNPYQQTCATLQSLGCASVSLYANGFTGAKLSDSAQEADLGRHDRRTIIGARWEHDIDSETTWRTTFDFDNRDINQPTSNTSSRGTYPSFDVISDVTHHGRLFGMTSTTLLGSFFNYEDINSYTYNVVAGGNANLGGDLGGETSSVFAHQLNAGFRGREELQLTPQLTAVFGLGVEHTELKALEANYAYSAVAAPSQSEIAALRTFNNVAPEASLQYRPQSGLILHARVGTGYGTPQATNLFVTPQGTFGNNTHLRPQTNVGVDVGAEWAPSATLHLFFTGFYEWFTDELVTQSAGVNLQSYTFNAPHSEHRGVEVGVDWRPLPAVLPGARLYASYLFDDQIYTSYLERLTSGAVSAAFNRDGNSIPGVTPSFGDVRLIYDQPSGALQEVGGFIEGVARDGYYLDNANLLKAPGYVLLNGELHYDPPPGPGAISHLRFYIDVQNLLDQTYIGTASNITDSLSSARTSERRLCVGEYDRLHLRRHAAVGVRRRAREVLRRVMSGLAHPTPLRTARTRRRPWPDYQAVWRWHFYAGLFCIPFVCWLACTGSIYLFKPQVEAWLDKPYAHLVHSSDVRASPSAEIKAALGAEAGAVLHAYQLPTSPDDAAQVLVGRGADEWRVWVHPVTLKVLKVVPEDSRLMKLVFRLHGELLLGDRGSMLVELAASWALVMIISGLYLWWPRSAHGLAGVLYPRFDRGRRLFWRDMHAVAGVWVSTFALFLLVSGLPWAKSWGGYLKEMRQVAGQAVVRQDWTTGRSSELAQRAALSAGSLAGQEVGKTDAMDGMHMGHGQWRGGPASRGPSPPGAYLAIDQVEPTVAALKLAYPVLIAPALKPGGAWSARSDAQNRPKRVTLQLDGRTGALLKREDFSQRNWVDQAVGVGVAAHEGQLFGWPNQLLGLFTALSLLTVSVSAGVLWWRRRPDGVLGAPIPRGSPRFSTGLLAIVLILGVLLPLLGASLIAVFLVERLVLRRIPGLRDWLGLQGRKVLHHRRSGIDPVER